MSGNILKSDPHFFMFAGLHQPADRANVYLIKKRAAGDTATSWADMPPGCTWLGGVDLDGQGADDPLYTVGVIRKASRDQDCHYKIVGTFTDRASALDALWDQRNRFVSNKPMEVTA